MIFIQPVLRVLVVATILYILVRFIWDIREIANHIRTQKK